MLDMLARRALQSVLVIFVMSILAFVGINLVGDPIYLIDPMKCTECVGAEDEPQCKLVCPADCIVPNPDYEETPEQLQEKYQSLHG